MMFRLKYIALASCLIASADSRAADSAMPNEPLFLEYSLVSMSGHDAALERDRFVLHQDMSESIILSLQYRSDGKHEWTRLNIGDGCALIDNNEHGIWQGLHHCTVMISQNDVSMEYLPYSLVVKNFLKTLSTEIDESWVVTKSQIIWNNENDEEIARFKRLEAAE